MGVGCCPLRCSGGPDRDCFSRRCSDRRQPAANSRCLPPGRWCCRAVEAGSRRMSGSERQVGHPRSSSRGGAWRRSIGLAGSSARPRYSVLCADDSYRMQPGGAHGPQRRRTVNGGAVPAGVAIQCGAKRGAGVNVFTGPAVRSTVTLTGSTAPNPPTTPTSTAISANRKEFRGVCFDCSFSIGVSCSRSDLIVLTD